MNELVATDLDGTYEFFDRLQPPPTLCITGRTWAEYDDLVKRIASIMPTYIRGKGAYGDRIDAGRFKATIIKELGVTRYYEDDPLQAEIIKKAVPEVDVILVR